MFILISKWSVTLWYWFYPPAGIVDICKLLWDEIMQYCSEEVDGITLCINKLLPVPLSGWFHLSECCKGKHPHSHCSPNKLENLSLWNKKSKQKLGHFMFSLQRYQWKTPLTISSKSPTYLSYFGIIHCSAFCLLNLIRHFDPRRHLCDAGVTWLPWLFRLQCSALRLRCNQLPSTVTTLFLSWIFWTGYLRHRKRVLPFWKSVEFLFSFSQLPLGTTPRLAFVRWVSNRDSHPVDFCLTSSFRALHLSDEEFRCRMVISEYSKHTLVFCHRQHIFLRLLRWLRLHTWLLSTQW